MADIFDLFKSIEKKETTYVGPPAWIVAGLGNPGQEYIHTRHNMGFTALDYVAGRLSADKEYKIGFNAHYTHAMIDGVHVLLAKPQTYMNASGESLQTACRFYKIEPDHVIILSDDISLAPGRVRVREKGSAGGHNGLKSVIERLSSENFYRIRIGVGEKPNPDYNLADWVLGKMPEEDQLKAKAVFPYVFEGIRKIVAGDLDGAKALCNGVRGDTL